MSCPFCTNPSVSNTLTHYPVAGARCTLKCKELTVMFYTAVNHNFDDCGSLKIKTKQKGKKYVNLNTV